MDNNYLIRNAYSNHDNFLLKYSKLIESINEKDVTWDQEKNESDMEPSIIHWKDKNGKTIIKAKYEILGIEIIDNNKKLWVWSWAHPLLDKNKTYLCRKILNYGLDIIDLDNSVNLLLKSLFTTSRLNLNDIEINFCVTLSLYLTKSIGYILLPNKNNETKYILIKEFFN